MTPRDKIIFQQVKMIHMKEYLLFKNEEFEKAKKFRGYIKLLENEYEDKILIGAR